MAIYSQFMKLSEIFLQYSFHFGSVLTD